MAFVVLPLVDKLVFVVLVLSEVDKELRRAVQVSIGCAETVEALFLLLVYGLRLHCVDIDEVGGLQRLEIEVEVDTIHREQDVEPIEEGPLVRLDNRILEEAESVPQFVGVVPESRPFSTDPEQKGRGHAVAGQNLRCAFLGEEFVHPVVIIRVDRSQRRRRIRAIIERDEEPPGVARARELVIHVALDGLPLLVRRDPVIEREKHRREEAVLDVVQVEGRNLPVQLDVVRGPDVIGQPVIEYAGLVCLDLVNDGRLGPIVVVIGRVFYRRVAGLPHP